MMSYPHIRRLEPVFLLTTLYVTFESALRYHCGPVRGSYRRKGDDIADALCANCERPVGDGQYPTWAQTSGIEGNPETEAALNRLMENGVRSQFYTTEEPGQREHRVLGVEANARTLRIVRKMAKQDLDAQNPSPSEAFDRKFNLWFNQHYAFDWQEWSARYPAETYPSPAEGSDWLKDYLGSIR